MKGPVTGYGGLESSLKVLKDLPCGRPQKLVAVKNVVGLQVGVSSTKKCVQHVSRGRDQSVMMFWYKRDDDVVVTWVITE